jgi:Na+/H+ antiporter NhaD/arsenite permease-like protein
MNIEFDEYGVVLLAAVIFAVYFVLTRKSIAREKDPEARAAHLEKVRKKQLMIKTILLLILIVTGIILIIAGQ